MILNWELALTEGFIGALRGVIDLAKIVVPIMIGLEILRDLKVLDRLAGVLHPTVKFMGISKEGTFPLLVGIVFGLSYGSGVLIQAANEGKLPRQERYLIGMFLSLCHAIIEDTFIFVALGATPLILVGFRLVPAVVFTWLLFLAFRRWSFAGGERVSGRSTV